MKTLSDILQGITPIIVKGNLDRSVSSVTFDSRQIKKESLFVAIKGVHTDGHHYISNALKAGATTIVYENDTYKVENNQITWIKVDNTAKTLGNMACNYYDNPSKKLKIVGITGTNGKTTCATLLYQSFTKIGIKTGLLSTIANYVLGNKIETLYTTPDAIQINYLLNKMHSVGCQWVIMEVSSHALAQFRTQGIQFTGAIFTNLTRDHLDFHLNFQDYTYAKKKLFDALPQDSFALINSDDKQSHVMVQNTKAKIYTYSIKRPADFNARIISNTMEGLELNIKSTSVWCNLAGSFNAYNLLTVYAVMNIVFDNYHAKALEILSTLVGVRGRFEKIVNNEGTIGIVDYCHTPDALKNMLETLHDISPNKEIITVLGTGGNRDKGKRPMMTSIALRLSTKLILTSDNPRDEDPKNIIRDMLQNTNEIEQKNILVIENREEAIKTASLLAKPKAIILVAGKGHETYQEVKGKRVHFDDTEKLKKYLL